MSNTNSLKMDKPVPASLLDSGSQGIIGRPLDRKDGPLKVTGQATYSAEYQIPNLAYGYLVGTKFGRGKVTKVDADSVRAIPGVIDVVTDFKTFLQNSQQGGETSAPTQGVQDVHYFGEIVAIVLAESYEAARDAGIRLKVEYEEAEGRFDFEAHKDETTKPPPNTIPAHFKQGDVEKAMADAAISVDVTYTTPSQNSSAMEPHASIAVWDEDGALTLYGSYQMPTSDKSQLAKSLGVSDKKVRIIAHYIGGGFGSKLGIAPESVAAAVAAKQLGRPVKAVMTRPQVFETTVRRSNTEQRVRFSVDGAGKLTGVGHETLTSNLPGEGFFEPTGIGTHFAYSGENRLINHDLVELDWLLSGSMRAPGEAVGMMATEAALDELCHKLGVDPIDFWKQNEPSEDPEENIPFSTRQLVRCLEEGAEKFGWSKRNATPGQVRDGEWMIGMGVAIAVRTNMLMESSAKVAIDANGRATVSSAMTDIGTGSYTILGQIAGELLGLPLDQVSVVLGDTDLPDAAGSGGSWGAGSSGSAVYLACEMLREKLAKAMGCDPEALTLKDGQAIADNRQVSLGSLVGDGIEAIGSIAPGKMEKERKQSSYGAHFVEVGVNATTGEVRVRRMLGVFSAGRILNAKTARSQCLGGMTFGIGAALTEDLVHDPRNGKLVNHDLGEYHVPVNADVPQIEVHFLEERDQFANPIHAKGIGELGISGCGAAIGNAVFNATGIRVRDYPITVDKLLDHLPPV
ncbi:MULTISPECIES: xanthine dehydrogenase family protein molybdopterin-binding subunit [unclassified Sphingomonas]|uniref:xanthine dehydrogenase family protein molybdopterin-binding subunit n=1 Tax=unclassified Sphingomonas TaxID=196159 RepID=UPI002AB54053|nr:xanthine dehydrogenase family protein molybdopterin-binding subunit [Sphingomonas sp. 10B4]MDY7523008.1 xanthine dehydrogenase family protein molybdopterin-binding subunit [Sphingomonas sp. 10B4]MEB0281279.1 xanthine dehydrogenase family protein molybdopterin-binding subunit [Sphingomonas sp. 10B4]